MKSLLTDEARAFLLNARVARLATADRRGAPHVVPVVFAARDEKIYVPVDGKQKKDADRLKRLANVRENGKVAFLVDHYEDDWTNLGFVLIFGSAAVIHAETHDAYGAAAEALREKYAQYRGRIALRGWMIEITPRRAASWGALRREGPAA